MHEIPGSHRDEEARSPSQDRTTTEQVQRLQSRAHRSATARLLRLNELRVLDRFRPVWEHGEGSTPYH